MKEKPSEDQMATLYSAVRYGDSIDKACKILKISRRQYDYWIKRAKRAKKKEHWDDPLTKDERQCLKLFNLMRSASIRRRRS